MLLLLPPFSDVPPDDEPPIEFCNVTVHGWLFTFTQIDFDGTNGLAFQCEWENPTSSAVTFGESARNEMCFMWMYYWPSHGFDSCINVPCNR